MVAATFGVEERTVVSRPGAPRAESPLVVWPPPITVDDGRFSMVRMRHDWLCRFATGRGCWSAPLRKFGLLEALRDAWDRAGDDAQALNVNGHKRKHRRLHADTTSAVRTLKVPRGPGSTQLVEVRACLRAQDLYLELRPAPLAWLYEWCCSEGHQETRATRTPVRNEGELVSARRGVFFSRAQGGGL